MRGQAKEAVQVHIPKAEKMPPSRLQPGQRHHQGYLVLRLPVPTGTHVSACIASPKILNPDKGSIR